MSPVQPKVFNLYSDSRKTYKSIATNQIIHKTAGQITEQLQVRGDYLTSELAHKHNFNVCHNPPLLLQDHYRKYPTISICLAQQLHHIRLESPQEEGETSPGHQLFSPLIYNMYKKWHS